MWSKQTCTEHFLEEDTCIGYVQQIHVFFDSFNNVRQTLTADQSDSQSQWLVALIQLFRVIRRLNLGLIAQNLLRKPNLAKLQAALSFIVSEGCTTNELS